MSTATKHIECSFHVRWHGRVREFMPGESPAPVQSPVRRVPHVSRLMALAIRFDQLLQEGLISNYAELARLGRVTQARVSQIMALLQLAPDIQEQLLFLRQIERGGGSLHMWQVLPIAGLLSWPAQRRRWRVLQSAAKPGRITRTS